MNVLRELNQKLKDENPFYFKLMKATVACFIFCALFFVAIIVGQWLDSESVRTVAMLLFGLSITGAILSYLVMLIILIVTVVRRLTSDEIG